MEHSVGTWQGTIYYDEPIANPTSIVRLFVDGEATIYHLIFNFSDLIDKRFKSEVTQGRRISLTGHLQENKHGVSWIDVTTWEWL